MKAIVNTIYGTPEVLQLKEVDKPQAKANELLIRVYATTVNRTDCAILSAKPFIMRFFTGLFKPKRTTQGTDFAGQVEAVGDAVKSFKVGDRVFGFNDEGLSSHAQYLCIADTEAIAKIPENINYQQAAASTEGAHYAYNFITKVNLIKGQKVLVNGATGAIGSAGLQLLKYFGAELVAVGNTKNLSLLAALGADQVIDYTREDFTKINQKFDFIFDAVGKSSFSKCKHLLRSGGIYTSSELGWMAQNVFYALLTPIFGKKKVIFPIPTDRVGSIRFIEKLLTQGAFKPVIDRSYPLEQIAKAYQYVGTGQKTGNVIITIE